MTVTTLASFDPDSGSRVERVLFRHRLAVLMLCLLATVVLGVFATRVQLNARFEDMVPKGHPYIANYLQNKSELRGLFPNAIRIAVESTHGSIFDARYMDTLRRINDEVFVLPGIDRPAMRSLWTASTRWLAVTEDGLDGGPVIPPDYDGSARSVAQLRANVERSGEEGQLVAANLQSSVIFVPLLSTDAHGKPLDYRALSTRLEEIRTKYQSDAVAIRITGFAKVVGDLIEGLKSVLLFFAAAIAIATTMLYGYTRCWRSTLLVVGCSLVAVLWQMGLVPLLGFQLDPYSVLVPFLVFAIGMSHGAQKMNGIMQDIARGAHRLVAARLTFRRLFMAGLAALLCDAVGFAVMMVIDIEAIHQLALIASVGVAALVFTNLILLPIFLSYVGVGEGAVRRSLAAEQDADGLGRPGRRRVLDAFTQRRWASMAVAVAALMAVGGLVAREDLKIGDLDAGAPELRPDSRYNRDSAFLTANYGASNDVFAVMVKTPNGQCAQYKVQAKVDALEGRMRQLPGVETTLSLASLSRQVTTMMNEGNAKWYELPRTQGLLNSVTNQVPPQLFNETCSMLALFAYLSDHKADTLTRVVDEVSAFARDNDNEDARFQLAAGNAGIEAATNIAVKSANQQMLLLVYGAVIVLCFIAFRSWRAVVCAVLPLMLTSVLAEALMAKLGMGVKVATLPVIALGVGIGVDYALYILSVMLAQLRAGRTVAEAYRAALHFTGRVVMLTGLTLAAGVATWVWSPIKFQSDMGVLLAFMFVWNMVGALVLLPALAHFLLEGSAARRPSHNLFRRFISKCSPASVPASALTGDKNA
jgi:predicted RND superfamily exporter protein